MIGLEQILPKLDKIAGISENKKTKFNLNLT